MFATAAVLGTSGPAASSETPTPTPVPASTPSLAEASRRARAAQGEDEIGKTSKVVISDDNLDEYASQGSLTETTRPTPRPDASRRPVHGSGTVTSTDPLGLDETPEMAEKRRYWQGQYQRQLELIASLEQQIQVLDETIPLLWRKFYAWDDPAYRDGVIKPELDQALARRESIEERLTDARGALGGIVEAARRDGAEPGWFRGIEIRQPVTSPTPDPAAGPGTATVRDLDSLKGGGG
jgi:predicted RNase H-like HicB family nuclease